MKDTFSDHEAGAKTSWIIEFSKEPREAHQKPAFSLHILAPKNPLKIKENPLIDWNNFEKVKENYALFLQAITKLCSLLEKEYKENFIELESTKKEMESVDSSIASLGEIIKKFNDLLKRFRKKDNKDS